MTDVTAPAFAAALAEHTFAGFFFGANSPRAACGFGRGWAKFVWIGQTWAGAGSPFGLGFFLDETGRRSLGGRHGGPRCLAYRLFGSNGH